jgi:Phytanoyl-CoA dioxygenase (PhyH)
MYTTENAARSHPSWAECDRAIQDHYVKYPVLEPLLPENRPRLQELVEKGIVFVEGLFDVEDMKLLQETLAPVVQAMQHQAIEAPSHILGSWPDLGRTRLYDIDHFCPETAIFRDHPVITDLVRAYLSNQEVLRRTTLEIRVAAPDWDEALVDLSPHADHIFREIKVYLALEDITEETGPLIYWSGTHRLGEWRKLPDYLSWIGGVWGDSHILTHNCMANLKAKHPEFADVEIVKCTAKAGSVVICDMRGIHRASLLRGGRRTHLYTTFDMQGYEREEINNPDWAQPLDLG